MRKLFTSGMVAACLAFTPGGKPVTDYRDPYAGSYFCKRNCLRISTADHNYLNTADTLTIQLNKDALDSIMQIRIGGDTIKAKLLSGYLSPYPDEANYGGNFFSADSINLDIFYGKALNCNYRGKKQ